MTFLIETTTEIANERIDDLFINAFDTGAINYWCTKVRFISPTGERIGFSTGADNFSVVKKLQQVGWKLRFYQEDEDPRDITLVSIGYALRIMADKYRGSHWKNFIDENDDAITADVFCQLCCFEEVVYG